LATLSAEVVLGYPNLGSIFQLQRSWASPSRAFLPFDDAESVSPFLLRSCTFLKNSTSFSPVLQRFAPAERAAPLTAIRRISSNRGQVALLGFCALQAFPRNGLEKSHLPFFSSPFTLQTRKPYSHRISWVLGFSVPLRTAFPLTGRQPAQLLCRRHSPSLQQFHLLWTIFSSRKPEYSFKPRYFLLTANALLPNGRW
jgi:hypothetical protein